MEVGLTIHWEFSLNIPLKKNDIIALRALSLKTKTLCPKICQETLRCASSFYIQYFFPLSYDWENSLNVLSLRRFSLAGSQWRQITIQSPVRSNGLKPARGHTLACPVVLAGFVARCQETPASVELFSLSHPFTVYVLISRLMMSAY